VKLAGNVNNVQVWSWVYPENRNEGFYDYSIALKPLRSNTSSGFFLPFMGMTQALTCALGISGTQGCDERPDGVMSAPEVPAAEDRSLFDGVAPQGQKASSSGPVLEDRSSEVARLHCGESLASPGNDAPGGELQCAQTVSK
jgi:hypothetical protein